MPRRRARRHSALANTTGQDLNKVLWLKSTNSEDWLQRRTNYTRSLALMSIVGYILGLGDRHPSNLMLHRSSGKLVREPAPPATSLLPPPPPLPEPQHHIHLHALQMFVLLPLGLLILIHRFSPARRRQTAYVPLLTYCCCCCCRCTSTLATASRLRSSETSSPNASPSG